MMSEGGMTPNSTFLLHGHAQGSTMARAQQRSCMLMAGRWPGSMRRNGRVGGGGAIAPEAHMRRGTSDSAKVCLVKWTICAPLGAWLSFAAAIASRCELTPLSQDEAGSPYLAAAPRPLQLLSNSKLLHFLHTRHCISRDDQHACMLADRASRTAESCHFTFHGSKLDLHRCTSSECGELANVATTSCVQAPFASGLLMAGSVTPIVVIPQNVNSLMHASKGQLICIDPQRPVA